MCMVVLKISIEFWFGFERNGGSFIEKLGRRFNEKLVRCFVILFNL